MSVSLAWLIVYRVSAYGPRLPDVKEIVWGTRAGSTSKSKASSMVPHTSEKHFPMESDSNVGWLQGTW